MGYEQEKHFSLPLDSDNGKIMVTNEVLQADPGLIFKIALNPQDYKPRVTVKVRELTQQEMRVANITLAPLRERVGEEIELSKQDQRILEDPRSWGGIRMSYVEDRVANGYGFTGFIRRTARNFLKRS
ncbi:MAG: hypothetical protein ACM3IJ_00660 [Candidatus Levyibacteriota bacterium]